MKLGDLGEDRLLNQILLNLPRGRGRKVFAGSADDCAIVEIPESKKYLVLKTDCVVEGVHFVHGTNASDVGWKAMMRPLSDFAAASAVPQFSLVTLIVPQKTKVAWVLGLYRGLRQAANRFKVSIVGGETSNTPGPIAISVTVIGFVEKPRAASRRGGRSGDDLFVTGRLGGALKRKHLKFVARIAESRWLTKHFSIHAMMDLSDGLGADLPRFARASKVGFDIQLENLPVARGATIDNAISEGEDYELLFAVSPRDRNRLEREWRRNFPELPLTRIGSLNRKSQIESQIANYLLATFISNSPAETEAIARQIAEDLVAGSVLALKGELGSGKTLFTQGLVAGLESDTAVTSPTFTIVHEYQSGRLPVYHFDFFRLENRESAVRLGLEDYFFSDGVSVIEWADRFPELIPEQARWISFEIKSERQRIITLFHQGHENSRA